MRWFSPCLNLACNKLVCQVQENQCPSKTIGLNNKQSAHLILCKWGHVRPWIKNDCPRVGSLEGTLLHHVVGQIDLECAIICSDVRAVELEWFVREAI